LRQYLNTQRALATTAMLSVLTAAGLTVGVSTPALAEFEIQESEVEKGETEIEYRGAVHSGVPKGDDDDGGDDDEVGELEEEEEGEGVRQSHEFEFQYGLTDRILLSASVATDEPIDGNFGLAGGELEGQYELIEREGGVIGFAIIGAYGFAARGGEADEIEFGTITELASGPLLLTVDQFFTAEVGDNRESGGLGFEYGWRAEYKVARSWGVGVEMFGEIEQLAHSGPFDDQNHSIGPTLFYNPGDGDDNIGGLGNDDDDEIAGEPEMEFVFNVGVQLGLTDATSDTALKFQGGLEF
jgi:hypothetical protein